MRETTFENARVGERLWHIRRGWGTISSIFTDGVEIVMDAKEPYVSLCHNMPTIPFNGKENQSDLTPSWFWDEVKIVAPERPKRMVKMKIRVRPFILDNGLKEVNVCRIISGARTPWCGPEQEIEIEVEE